MNKSEVLVGAGRVDITPAMGIQIAGGIGMHRPTEEIRGRLYADALVIRSQGKTICMVSAPPTNISRRFADSIRAECAALLATSPDAVAIHVTQSHSSPAVGDNLIFDPSPRIPADLAWVYGGDPNYNGPFHRGVVEAVKQAQASLRPATARAGRAVDSRIAFNRRFILRDGSAAMHPGTCNPNVLQPEGPADPEIGMVIFDDDSGKAIAALLHFTCHPCHGYGKRWIHPDWPGAWGEAVRSQLGSGCIPVVMNGFCGNVHHQDHLHPTQHLHDTIENMTGLLMEATTRAVATLQPIAIDDVRFVSRRFPVPWRVPAKEEHAAATALLQAHPAPYWVNGEIPWDWILAVGMEQHVERCKTSHSYSFEAQILRAGDVGMIAMPGEPFVEGQLALKLRSPIPYLFCSHASNDNPGYFPTRKAYEGKGYETVGRFQPGCLELIIEHTAAMLREIGS